MAYPRWRDGLGRGLFAGLLLQAAGPAWAQFFFYSPDFSGLPVMGNEPGIAEPLPGATPAELRANLLWGLRAGLNVAALQCQFAPSLRTVPTYNALLVHHGKELNAAYSTMTKYFKRTVKGSREAQIALDQYTTRTYQGFSTFYGQLGFCQTATRIGYDALSRPKGALAQTAFNRMREFRNSLAPYRDPVFPKRYIEVPPGRPMPPLDPKCYDKKNNLREKCMG